MSKEKDSVGFLVFKYGIYTLLTGLLVMKITGNSPEVLIHRYKLRREMENIHYGGSVSEVNKYIQKRNNKVKEVINLTENKVKQLQNVIYFTNDTVNIDSALVQANREYRSNYSDPYRIGRDYIEESKETIKYINEFKEKIDSLGFNIFIDRGKTNSFVKNQFASKFENKFSSDLCIKNVNEERENIYIVIQLKRYTETEKKYLTEHIKNRNPIWFSAVGTTLEKEISLLDEIQFSQVIFTEQELQKQKINLKGIQSFLSTRTNLTEKSIYYFSCYNKKMDRLTFMKKVELFKTMFFKKQIDSKGQLVTVALTSKNLQSKK